MRLTELVLTGQVIDLSKLAKDRELCRDIQYRLSKLGYLDLVDGIYGKLTKKAFRQWKRDNYMSQPLKLGAGSAGKLIEQSDRVRGAEDIDWNDMNAKVSRYFTVREVTRGLRSRIPKIRSHQLNIIRLAQELDKVRDAWGSPIYVNSWYRYGTGIGARNSQHNYGKAADIRPKHRGDLGRFQEWLDKVAWRERALGYGAKKGFVHVDLRKGRIRWNY